MPWRREARGQTANDCLGGQNSLRGKAQGRRPDRGLGVCGRMVHAYRPTHSDGGLVQTRRPRARWGMGNRPPDRTRGRTGHRPGSSAGSGPFEWLGSGALGGLSIPVQVPRSGVAAGRVSQGCSIRMPLREQELRTQSRHQKEAGLHKNREGGSAHEGECGESRAISV
jgi:hypothetical protein